MTQRIGIFGGTFDPVHLGHLVVAEQCREQAGLDQVWFVPAARPPHKPAGELTPFHRRVEMLQLASAGQPAFRVEELEKDRAGPSYTVDTLEEIHAASRSWSCISSSAPIRWRTSRNGVTRPASSRWRRCWWRPGRAGT